MENFGREKLTRAIKSITRATDLNAKFCFFIDGLDEYQGFDREIASTINTLASSPSVKICVASRPHNVFVNAFGGNSDHMLYVHEYTGSDIQHYIKDVLETNPDFVSRTHQDPWGYRQLVEYIRKEANGVFLWVYLVVANILDDMENADRMSDLQRKLKKVPKDLKALFTHILNTVEAEYHEQQAQVLQVACQTEQPLSLIGYSFLGEEHPDFALKCPVGPMPPEEVLRRYNYMEKRVVARCRLLLEVVERPDSNPDFPKYVTFLHRTVRDYLREPEAQNLLASRLSGPFDPRRKLCDALLAEIKCAPVLASGGFRQRLIVQLLRVAKQVERLSIEPMAYHLDSLKSAINDLKVPYFERYPPGQAGEVQRPGDNPTRFLKLVVQSSLPAYLKWRLQSKHDELHLSPAQKASLLASSLYKKGYRLALDINFTTEIVKMLLKSGADPNFPHKHHHITPWTAFVISALSHFKEMLSQFKENSISFSHRSSDAHLDKELFLVFEQMILAGADLDILYQPPRSSQEPHTILTIEECIRRTITLGNAKYLLDLIKRQRQQCPRLYRHMRWYMSKSGLSRIAYDETMTESRLGWRKDPDGNGIFDLLNRGPEASLTKAEKNKSMVSWQSCGVILFLLISILLYGRFPQVDGVK